MAAVAVVGVLAFLIYLVAAYARRPRPAVAEGVTLAHGPRWYELGLAVVVLLAIVILLFWQFPPGSLPGMAQSEWQTDARSLTFFIVMLIDRWWRWCRRFHRFHHRAECPGRS